MAGGGMGAAAPTQTGQAQQAPQQAALSPLAQQQMMRQQAPQQMYNPYQMQQAPQQMVRTQMQPQQISGLQAALMQMLGRYNQPMMRPQMQAMPQYQNPALAYRPNMESAQGALNRTAVTKAEAQAAAEKAALAKLGLGEGTDDDSGFRAWQRQQYLNSLNNSGGGG